MSHMTHIAILIFAAAVLGAAASLLGTFAGAWVYHRGRQQRDPAPPIIQQFARLYEEQRRQRAADTPDPAQGDAERGRLPKDPKRRAKV